MDSIFCLQKLYVVGSQGNFWAMILYYNILFTHKQNLSVILCAAFEHNVAAIN